MEKELKKNKEIAILTFARYEGRKGIGSSRIRGEWLVNHWPEAEIFRHGADYDVVIYQKAYFVEHARKFKGIKIFDICDADFLHYGYRTMEMIDECDAVTCSSEQLAEQFKKFTDKPVVYIPDRIDLDTINVKKEHIGDAEVVVWYGYSTGFYLLKPIISFLSKLGLTLLVISDCDFNIGLGDKLNVINKRWNEGTVNEDIIKGDIVINPFSKKGKWKFKSNNKTMNAKALGMPVATNSSELNELINVDARKKASEEGLIEVASEYDVKLSVRDYNELINSIKDGKVKE